MKRNVRTVCARSSLVSLFFLHYVTKASKLVVLCWLVTLSLCLFVTSCSTESYDTGDGDYSYLRADFCEIHTAGTKQVDYAISDDGERISFGKTLNVKWAEGTDTLYRALLYYNRLPDAAKALSLQPVYVLRPKAPASVENPHYDPVAFESAWISTCQRTDLTIALDSVSREAVTYYLNIAFLVKTGQPDDETARQSIGISSEQNSDGTWQLTLLHDQGSVPQYYSTRVYASIPLADSQLQRGIIFNINTYDGQKSRAFSLSQK